MGSRGLVRSNAVVSPTLVEEETGSLRQDRENRVETSDKGGGLRREAECENGTNVSSASRPDSTSTSDPKLEADIVALPEFITVMRIRCPQKYPQTSLFPRLLALQRTSKLILHLRLWQWDTVYDPRVGL
eukprot:461402-Rhodomonas_salina.2